MTPDLTVGDWQWQVWELHPKTGRPMKWCGQFFNHKSAFDWIDGQPRGRDGYRVNNVPPRQKPSKPLGDTSITATSPTKVEQRQDVDEFPVRKMTETERLAEKRKQDFRKRREAEKVVGQKKTVRAKKPKDSKEMSKIKADAQQIIDKHKSDEQADLEAGVNH